MCSQRLDDRTQVSSYGEGETGEEETSIALTNRNSTMHLDLSIIEWPTGRCRQSECVKNSRSEEREAEKIFFTQFRGASCGRVEFQNFHPAPTEKFNLSPPPTLGLFFPRKCTGGDSGARVETNRRKNGKKHVL